MGHDVSLEHPALDVQLLPFDDNVLDAADIGLLSLKAGQPFDPRMTSDKEAVVRVGRGHARNADSRLGKNLVN